MDKSPFVLIGPGALNATNDDGDRGGSRRQFPTDKKSRRLLPCTLSRFFFSIFSSFSYL
jgi:hypothetical protein